MNRTHKRRRAIAVALAAVCAMASCAHSQTLVDDLGGVLTHAGQISLPGIVGQIAFAPGDSSHAYVATFGGGVMRYDYDPASANFLTNPTVAVPSSITSRSGEVDGSLGLAFHEDPELGTVMYLAPAVGFGGSALRSQDLVRLNDANGDGVFGNGGDLNQSIVESIGVSLLHQVNQLAVRDNTLFVSIGIRTQNGGQTAAQNQAIGGSGVDQSDPGETAYTGSLNFIEDLTTLSNDSSTANISGFTISDLTGDGLVDDLDARADSQPFTSTDPSKLRVYATGFRNNFGVGVDGEGEIWVSFNQNENPNAQDELHRGVEFQTDHQFFKGNDVVGDWKVAGDEAPNLTENPSQLAIDAGYFDPSKSVPVFARVGFNTAAGGLAFFDDSYSEETLRGDVLLARNAGSGQDIIHVDRLTGATSVVLEGVPGALEVAADPFGNFLYGGTGAIGLIQRLDQILGDFSGDGVIDTADWNLLKPRFLLDTSALSNAEARASGDLDLNGIIDFDDLNAFAAIFDEANGVGAFQRLQTVPEPTAAMLFVASFTSTLLSAQRRGRAAN